MAAFLVAAPARNGGSMGEVKQVPGVTESQLRQAVIDQVTALCQPLEPLRSDEVTVGDMAAEWQRPEASVRNVLDRQVKDGVMTRRKALDPRTRRECVAYRLVDNS